MSETSAETLPGTSALESSEVTLLDPGSKARLFRLALKSLLFVLACVAVKLPLTPVVVFLYFVFIKVRYQLQTPDLFAIWLVAAPFLGPYDTSHIGGGIPDINFSRLFVLLLLFSAFSGREGPRVRLLTNRLDYSVVFFIGACFLSVLGSFMIRRPLQMFLDALVIPGAFYLVAKKCAGRSDFLPKLFIAAVLALLALGALGTYEGLSGHDILRFEDEDSHAEGSGDFRVNGPLSTAEHYGIIMVMLLLFVGMLKTFCAARLSRIRYLRLAMLVGVVAVAYTLTRGIWFSLLAGWLTFYLRRRPMLTFSVAGCGIVVWLILQQAILPQVFGEFWQNRMAQRKTIYARIATYKSALAMFQDNPVLGVGFGTYTETWERFPERYFFQYNEMDSVPTPHNLFLAILAEMGLMGALAFIVLQSQIFAKALRLARTARDVLQVNYAEVVLAIATAFLVAGLGLNFTYDTGFVTKLYFMFLGILSAMADVTSEGQREIPAVSPVRNK